MFKSLVVSFLLTGCLGSSVNNVNVPIVDNYVPQTNVVNIYQGVKNGKPYGLTDISSTGASISISNESLRFTFGSSASINFSSYLSLNNGVNSIFVSFDIINNSWSDGSYADFDYNVIVGTDTGVGNYTSSTVYITTNIGHVSFIYNNSQSSPTNYIDAVIFNVSRSGGYGVVQVSNFQVYNLTTIFGSGNEPSKTIFEQMIGNQYYDFGSHKIDLDWHTGDRVYGLYNLKDYMDFTVSDFPYYEVSDPIETIVFEDTTEGYFKINPMLWNGQTVYLSSMRLQANFINGRFGIGIELNYYNYVVSGFTATYFIPSGSRLSDIPSGDVNTFGKLILQVNQFKDMSIRANQYFNAIFTHEDNYFVTSYSGYYNISSSSIPYSVNVFGSFTFNNSLYFGLTNNVNGLEPTYIRCAHWGLPDDWVYDGVINGYYYDGYDLPLTNTQVVNFNFQFSYVKLTYDTYTSLSNVGTWQFVRDTSYDNVDFYDLMFAIGDTPIYFISRLLSFELFGMNLFVALTGLLTVCAILFLIRKFF